MRKRQGKALNITWVRAKDSGKTGNNQVCGKNLAAI